MAADDQPGNAVARRDSRQRLDGVVIVKTTVTAGDERGTLEAPGGINDALEEIFQIPGLLEHCDFLAKPGRSGLLIRVGLGLD